MKPDYTQFVHEFERNGQTRYAIGQWDAERGQYYRPFDHQEAKLTGCSGEFAQKPGGMQSYKTRKQALARARYLFGEAEEWQIELARLEQWEQDHPGEMSLIRTAEEAVTALRDKEIAAWLKEQETNPA